MAIQPISFPTSGIESPILSGIKESNDLIKQALLNRIYGVQAQYAEPTTQEELQKAKLANIISAVKAKYAEPTEQEALREKQLHNQYYGRNIESQIGLRGAQAGHFGAETNELNQMLPGELIAQTLKNKAMQQESSMAPGTSNKLNSWDRQPTPVKNAEIAQAVAFGPNHGQAYDMLRNQGMRVEQIAEMNGYDPKNPSSWPDPIYPATTQTQSAEQSAERANASRKSLESYVSTNLAPYVKQINGVPLQAIYDQLSSTKLSKLKRGKALAAATLAQDTNFLQAKSLNAPLGIGLLDEMSETAQTKLHIPGIMRDPEVYEIARTEIGNELDKARKASRQAAFGQRGHANRSRKHPSEMTTEELEAELEGK